MVSLFYTNEREDLMTDVANAQTSMLAAFTAYKSAMAECIAGVDEIMSNAANQLPRAEDHDVRIGAGNSPEGEAEAPLHLEGDKNAEADSTEAVKRNAHRDEIIEKPLEPDVAKEGELREDQGARSPEGLFNTHLAAKTIAIDEADEVEPTDPPKTETAPSPTGTEERQPEDFNASDDSGEQDDQLEPLTERRFDDDRRRKYAFKISGGDYCGLNVVLLSPSSLGNGAKIRLVASGKTLTWPTHRCQFGPLPLYSHL
ncbi:unnamed protein product, partial [Mesorhabditis spiculigera]